MEFDTKENSIIAVRTEELKENHNRYIERHPELQQILNDFISEVLLEKPADPIAFSREYFGKFNPNPEPFYPLAILGPKGVGKKTFINKLLETYPDIFEIPKMISNHPGNPNTDYISTEELEILQEQNELLHISKENDRVSGISLKSVQEIYSKSKISILVISVESAIKIYNNKFEFNRIFVMPRNMKQLEDRLRAQGINDENVLRVQLRAALAEVELAQKHPHIFRDFVVNDLFEDALKDFLHILHRCYERLTPENFKKFYPQPSYNNPLALVGPSGVGKSTLITLLMESFPGVFEFSVSSTTRLPRAGEEHGVNYYYISREEFMKKIEENEFIEYNEVHNNLYGTSKTAIQNIFAKGKICLLDVDVKGILKLVDSGLEFNRIFIKPKDLESLEKRLRGRGTDPEDVIRNRIKNSFKEIDTAEKNPVIFSNILINDNLDKAGQDLIEYVKKFYPRLKILQPTQTNPLALVGPSGVGKSTLITLLMESFPGVFEFSVSSTTRLPRAGEEHGVNYYYISREEFMKKIEENEFIEYNEVHNNLYGTSKTALQNIAKKGKICLLDVDVQGILKLVDSGLEFNRIFIKPKDLESLEKRLRGRGTDPEDVIRNRIKNSFREIEIAEKNPAIFSNILINDDLEKAKEGLIKYVKKFYSRLN
jgi:guanylate kinase